MLNRTHADGGTILPRRGGLADVVPALKARKVGGAWLILAVFLALVAFYPLVMLGREIAVNASEAVSALNTLPGIGLAIRRTLILGAIATPIAVVLGVSLALAVNNLTPRVRKVVSFLPMMPLVIPVVAFVVGWAFLLSPSAGYLNTLLRMTPFFDNRDSGPIDIYSFTWIVILSGIRLSSFVYVFVYTAVRNMGPQYEEAAATSGASGIRSLFTVKLPLLRPALVNGTVTALLLSLGEFSVPLLLGRTSGVDVITTKVYTLTHQYPANYAAAASLAAMLLAFGVVMIFAVRRLLGDQRRFVMVSSSVKAVPKKSSPWSLAWVGFYVLITVVLPLLALIYVSLQPYWSRDFQLDNFTMDSIKTVLFEDQRSISALRMSIQTAAIATLILLPIGFFAALGTLDHIKVPRGLRKLLEVSPTVTLAVPNAVFAFGLLIAYTQAPVALYGSVSLLILGYITITLPYARSTQFSTLVSLDSSYWEASKVSGGGGLRTLLMIIVPLARVGIAGGAALIFVLLSHEFTVSMMVGTAQTQVLGMLLYDYWNGGTYPQVAALALVMTVVTAVGVLFALAIGGRRGLLDER